MEEASLNLMELIWKNIVALTAIYAAIVSTISIYLRIKDNKRDVRVEIFKDNKTKMIRSGEDGSFGKVPVSYWHILARNHGSKTVVIDSFWIVIQYGNSENQFFDEPKRDRLEHDDGIIKFPYEITYKNKLSIALNNNYFDSFLKLLKENNPGMSPTKFKLIAYFEDNLGKKYKSKPVNI